MPHFPASIAACEQLRKGGAIAPVSEWPAVHKSLIVEASHGERPPKHVVEATSPVAWNACSTQQCG